MQNNPIYHILVCIDYYHLSYHFKFIFVFQPRFIARRWTMSRWISGSWAPWPSTSSQDVMPSSRAGAPGGPWRRRDGGVDFRWFFFVN